MRRIKTLLSKTNKNFAYSIIPRTGDEILDRFEDYTALTEKEFAKKHQFEWHEPFALIYDNKEYEIQLNFCTDPFCKWFGKPQEHFNGKLDAFPIKRTLRS